MKKLLSLTLALAIIICAVPLGTFTFTASAETSSYYTYSVSNGKATITDVSTSISGDITIPSTLGGYPVTSIGSYAFEDCKSLTSITIPDSVTGIGKYAFYGCSSLTSVTIPDSVTSIGGRAFSGCSSLTSITIPDSVTNIGDYAFRGCSSLTSVTIGDSVTSIGDYAFCDCASLTSVTIPDSVTSIGDSAFLGCESLTSVTIGDGVTSIGDFAFLGCESLTEIVVSKNNNKYSSQDGVLFNKDKTILIQYPIGKINTSYIIPNSVTSIGDFAFSHCESLTNITIPDSVTNIGVWVFSYCDSLTNITIPNSVTSIGKYAFYICSSLKSVTIPDSVTFIGDEAFSGCSSLADVYYKGSEAQANGISIGSNNENLKNAKWHYNCLLFTDDVFGFVVSNGEVTITDVNKNISGDITIPSTLGGYPVTSIGGGAFYGCSSLTSVTILDSVTSIGDDAFDYCTGLTTVNFNATNCTSMGSYYYPVFKNCTNLTTVNIGANVQIIPSYAFYGCTGLTSITIPDSVTSIGSSAFEGCNNLQYLKIPFVGQNADGTGFTNFGYIFGAANESYPEYHNADYVPKSLKDVVTGSINIAANAFYDCKYITSISFTGDIKLIGEWAFGGCNGLKKVMLPASLKTIRSKAFYDCINLTDVYYRGNSSQRNNIAIEYGNDPLEDAAWHYNYGKITYPDVSDNAWYTEAVEYVSKNGIMSGYSNGKFGTSDSIQRQDFLVMLARLDGVNLDNYKYKSSFPDVARNSYYEAAVNWGAENGIVTGYKNGKFGVGDKVTREQLVTFLYRYAKYKGYDSDYSSNRENVVSRQYKDYKNVSGFAKQPILWAIEKGVISGKTSTTIVPQGNAQRCEVAKIMYNIYLNDIFN